MAEETILVKVVLEAGEYKAEIEKISQVSGTAEKAVSGLEESTKGLGAQLQKGVGLSEFKKGADEVTASLSRQKGVVEQIENDIKQLNKQLQNTAPGKAQQTLQKEVNAANRVLKEEIAILKGIQSETEKTGAKKVSLTSKVRQLRNELVALELAGKRDTEQFRQLSREAGILQDAITDVSQQTKNLASDTANLDAFAQGITGLAGGFAAAQGAAALFGKENEDVQKALLKVQATLAIVNGLQAVFNTLQKQSAFSLKANAAATTIATGAMRLFGVAVNTTSFAFKALRAAIIATGIGAIVAIIGTLASKLDSLTSSAKESADSFKELNDQVEDLKKKTNELRTDALKSSIRLAVAQGKYTELLGKEKITLIDLKTEQDKLTQQKIQDKVAEVNATEAAIKALEKQISAERKARDASALLEDDKVAKSAKFIEIEKQQQKIKAESAERLKAIDKEYEEQRTLGSKIASDIIEIDRIEAAKKGAAKEIKIEKEKFEKIVLISIELEAKRRAAVFALQKKDSAQNRSTLLRIVKEQKTLELQQLNDFNEDFVVAQNKLVDAELAVTIDGLKNEQAERLLAGENEVAVITEIDAKIKNARQKSINEQKANEEDFKNFRIQQNEQVFQAFVGTTNALFQLQQSLNAAAISDLQKQRDAELASFVGTEEQKARIQERFAAEEKQLKIKAAQDERNAAIFNAIINTAVAITAALKAGVTAPALVALAAITGAAQLAAIKAAPLPQFEKGGKVEGKSHRLGGTIIEAERDEFVVNKKAVRKHEPFIEAINKADGSFERMVFDKFVFPKIADLSPSQATILKATFKSDKIEKELRMSRKADQKNTKLLAGIMQSERHHSQSERYKW
jgi:hypothetical protein